MAEESEIQVQNDISNNKIHRSRSGFWFGIFILLTIISLAGIGYILLDQLRETQEDLGGEVSKDDMRLMELTKQITGYQSQLASIQSQLRDMNAEISGKDTHYNKKLEDFSKMHHEKLDTTKQNLTASVRQIQRQLGKTRGDWLIADAEYLLSIANQRLHLMDDVKTTEEALTAADQRLRESGDAAVYKVREQLAKEIALIKKITMPDIVGIYSKIQILEDNVEKLNLFLPFPGKGVTKPDQKMPGQTEEADETEQQIDELQDILDSAFGELGDLVTIRRTDKPITAVLTAEEAYFIQQQMKVKLEMVKLALVERNDPLYKSGIDDAKNWLQDNFLDNEVARGYGDELDRLAAIDLRRQLPDISKSLKMLRDITKLRLETDKALLAPEEDLQSPAEAAQPEAAEEAKPVVAEEAQSAVAEEPGEVPDKSMQTPSNNASPTPANQ